MTLFGPLRIENMQPVDVESEPLGGQPETYIQTQSDISWTAVHNLARQPSRIAVVQNLGDDEEASTVTVTANAHTIIAIFERPMTGRLEFT